MVDIRNGNGENGLTALFVRRPVFAFVLNTLIAVAGLAAFYGVEIRELPDVDRPVITVNADFVGAAAETYFGKPAYSCHECSFRKVFSSAALG